MRRTSMLLPLTFVIALILLISSVRGEQIYKGQGTPGGLVPDFTQTIKDKNGGICCAAAMANSLWFWDQHGYSDLVKQKDESNPNANWEADGEALVLDLARKIYGENYVNNPNAENSNGLGQEKGVQAYLDQHKTLGKEPLVIEYIDGKDATYDRWEKELKDCEDVVAKVTWRDAAGNDFRHVSHALTGVGYDTEKKKFKVSHGWGNHAGEEKPYPDIPDTKDYFQEYNMIITPDGRIKIPKAQNADKDLFQGRNRGDADHLLVDGFWRISPGEKIKPKDKRTPTPKPEKDKYSYSIENTDFHPIYQFALEVQVPFSDVGSPEGWAWIPWNPSLTLDVTPGPCFEKPPGEVTIEVVWKPEWRGVLWYTLSSPIMPSSELSGFSFEVDSDCGHSEMASFAGFSSGITSYITGSKDIGLTTEFATTSGPLRPRVGGVGVPASEFALLAPYIITIAAIVAISIGTMCARKRWFRKLAVKGY